MTKTIRIKVDARGVAYLWLARPEKHNALSQQMLLELMQAAQDLGGDGHIRAVVLGADGPSFCAGGDLAWMRQHMQADPVTRRAAAGTLALMLNALNELPKPLIGRVHGNAFGGGIGLISVCDVAVAVPSVRMGFTEAALGITPATIAPYVLARMGEAKARRVFMSARRFSASEAVALNLIAGTVASEDLDAAVEAEVAPYLSCAPGAVAASKRLARSLGPRIGPAEIEASIDALVEAWQHDEAAEGISAFLERRKPRWQD